MDIEISCFHCRKRYKVDSSTVRVSGPVIQASCPFCRKKTVKNLGSFVEKQIRNKRSMGRFDIVSVMINLAKIIERESY